MGNKTYVTSGGKHKLKTRKEVNEVLGKTARGVTGSFTRAAANVMREFIKDDLYGRQKSPYYERTNTFQKTVAVKKTERLGKGHFESGIYFDLSKLRHRDPEYKISRLGKRYLVRFGAHRDRHNEDVDERFPWLIERGYNIFEGEDFPGVKEIEGVRMIENTNKWIKDNIKRISKYKINQYDFDTEGGTDEDDIDIIFSAMNRQ